MNIYHADLKPSNVLVSNDFKRIKLVDFGLSVVSSHSNFTQSMGYTPHYMAPEQIFNKVNAKSDIYSFGCLLYHLCTYDKPWKDLNQIQVVGKYYSKETLSIDNQNIPVNWKKILQKCLQYDPNHRSTSLEICESLIGMKENIDC